MRVEEALEGQLLFILVGLLGGLVVAAGAWPLLSDFTCGEFRRVGAVAGLWPVLAEFTRSQIREGRCLCMAV